MRPTLWLAFLLSGLLGLSPSAGRASTAGLAPDAVAHLVWDKLLTQCGDSYFYAGSPFDTAGMLSNVQVSHQGVMEYRGVRFHHVPIRVTDAEQANGLSYRGRISIMAHLYREKGEPWRDGLDLQPRNFDDIAGLALSQVGSDMFDMGSNGAIALELVKFKGVWMISRSSATSSSSFGFGSKFYDVDKLLAVPLPRYSCASGSVIAPPPSQAEINAQKAARDKQQADLRQFQADMAKNKAIKAAALNAWGFTGTAEEFRSALIENLNKRAGDLDVNPGDYAADVDRIMRIVAVCTNLTHDDLSAYWRVIHNRQSREAIHNCDGVDGGGGRFGVFVSQAGGRKRAIQVDEHVYETGPDGFHPIMPRYFTINVYFDTADGDPYIEPHHLDEAYIIISGKIAMRNYVSETALQDAEKAVVHDAGKGVPFAPVSAFQFTALRSYYDETGASRFIDKRLPDGSSVPIEFYLFQQLINGFPKYPGDNDWLPPGTTYETPCRAMVRGRCEGIYTSNAASGTHNYMIIQVTSGPHQGQYALIDKGNYVAGSGVICPTNGTAGQC